jgi:hypothetical protein
MRRTVPVTRGNSTVDGDRADREDCAVWWARAQWSSAVECGAHLNVTVEYAPGCAGTCRVRPVDRLGPRRPVRDAGSVTGWAWEVV